MPSDPISNINWSTTYARITDMGWAGLQTDLIRVDLADLPGDALRRGFYEQSILLREVRV
jgi:hypothetical protein